MAECKGKLPEDVIVMNATIECTACYERIIPSLTYTDGVRSEHITGTLCVQRI